MAIQFATALSAGSVTSQGVTLGATPGDGNLLVALIATANAATGQVSSISQTGATWVRAVEVASASNTTEIWYAENVSGAGTSVTVNYSGTALTNIIILEFDGIVSSSSLDQTASNTGTYPGSADSGTTATTSQANEVWVAALTDEIFPSGTWNSPSNSFTEVTETANIFLNMVGEERTVTATGTANTSAGRGSAPLSGDWSGCVATFKKRENRRSFVV